MPPTSEPRTDGPASSSLGEIVDLSYAAGLIDGEGYIGIQEAGGSMQLRLKIVMTDKGLPSLIAMHRAFGGKLAEDRPIGERTRATHVWRLNGRKAADLIERLQSKLLTKAEPARIALEFQQMIDAAPKRANRSAVWDEDMHRWARIFRARIQEANRRGPDAPPPALPPERPLAVRKYGEWWEPDEDLFGPVEFAGRFPTSGTMIAGHVYPLDVQLPASAMPSGLLPTPRTTDGNGPGLHGTGGQDLRTTVTLLPTPTTEPTTGNGHARNLGAEAKLLPTPLNSDAGPRGGTTGFGLRDWSRAMALGATTSPPSGAGSD